MNRIELPCSFIRENKKMLAKTCLLGVAGNSWEAKIVKEKSKYFICEGEWPQFVVHHKLELWDILHFLLIDKSKFHVLPYTQKCRLNFHEKRLAFEELSSSSEDEIGPSRKSKKVKVDDAIEISDCEEESIDTSSDDESKDGDINPSCSRQAKYKKPKREMVSAGYNIILLYMHLEYVIWFIIYNLLMHEKALGTLIYLNIWYM
nr:uncharacterized protein LOC117280876 [Nicotiana tomentosiformis]